jgi:hypothetical protein
MTGSEILALAVAVSQGIVPPSSYGTSRESVHWASGSEVYGPAPADAEPAPEPAPDMSWSTPPGGYWAPGEVRSPEPPDGHEKLLAAYILVPLGALRTASGAAGTWLSMPGQCEERWGRLGASPDAGQCRGLLILNAIRTTYGALMFGSRLVLLGIGLHQRKKWRAWKARGGVGIG